MLLVFKHVEIASKTSYILKSLYCLNELTLKIVDYKEGRVPADKLHLHAHTNIYIYINQWRRVVCKLGYALPPIFFTNVYDNILQYFI